MNRFVLCAGRSSFGGTVICGGGGGQRFTEGNTSASWMHLQGVASVQTFLFPLSTFEGMMMNPRNRSGRLQELLDQYSESHDYLRGVKTGL